MWKKYLLGILISLAALWLFFTGFNLQDFTHALGRMNLWCLLPNLLLLAAGFWLRAVRWHYLMRPVARVRLRSLFAALMVGFLGNNVLPAHLGEVVRAMVLGREEKVSASATLATIVLERVYDGLAVLLMLLLVMLALDLPAEAEHGGITLAGLRAGGWIGLVVFLGALLALQAFRIWRGPSLKLLAILLRPLPERISQKALQLAEAFAEGLAVSRASDLAWVALYSILVWVAYSLWAWSLVLAFGLPLGYWSGVLVEVVVALSLVIPAAPGFVGTFHVAASAALLFLGVDPAMAAGYAMMLWLAHFVFTSAVGFYYYWRLGLGWRELTGGKQKP